MSGPYRGRGRQPASPLPPATFGLGDAVALIAGPIARALDEVFGTRIAANCDGCDERKRWLNNLSNRNP